MNDFPDPESRIVDRLAPAMFSLAVVFVLLLGALIVVRVDIPRVVELEALERAAASEAAGRGTDIAAGGATDGADRGDVGTGSGLVGAGPVGVLALGRLGEAVAEDAERSLWLARADRAGDVLLIALLALWPLFWLEYLVTLPHQRHRPFARAALPRLFACLVPPWRLATPSGARDDRVWLPTLGWQRPGRALERTLARRSGTPMLVVALFILPVLLLEVAFGALIDEHASLRLLLHVSTGLIWCAFALEFCILIGASERKLDYARRHWLDLAIILLPLISFLRSVRALRLARLARVQKLAKIGRVYRLRGLAMKAVRALMLLDAVGRLLRIPPERRLATLRRRREELAEDLAELDAEIATMERRVCQGAGDGWDDGGAGERAVLDGRSG